MDAWKIIAFIQINRAKSADLSRLVSFNLKTLSNLSIVLSLVCFQTFVVRSPWLAFTVNPVTIADLRGCEVHHQFFSCYYFEDNSGQSGKKMEYFICLSERCIYARTPKLELSALAFLQTFIVISPWLAFCMNSRSSNSKAPGLPSTSRKFQIVFIWKTVQSLGKKEYFIC